MLDHQSRSDASGFQHNGEAGKLIHGLPVVRGQVGQPPATRGQSFQYSLRVKGRLSETKEFADVIVGSQPDGSFIARMQGGLDIAHMPEGGTFFDQSYFPYLDGYPADFRDLPTEMGRILWAALVHSPWDHAGDPGFWDTLRANALVPLQTIWQRGCADLRSRAQSRRCRAALLRASSCRRASSGGICGRTSTVKRDPVIGVPLAGALAYAKWAGKRLPTPVEWALAALGPGEGQSGTMNILIARDGVSPRSSPGVTPSPLLRPSP